jgi:hypothetical protein
MKDVAKALEDKDKKHIPEHIFHFRVKEMHNKSATGQVRRKVELGMNLLGDYSTPCLDFDGTKSKASCRRITCTSCSTGSRRRSARVTR